MTVLRLASTIGSMPAHIRLSSSSAVGSRASKLDSHTIRVPVPAGSVGTGGW